MYFFYKSLNIQNGIGHKIALDAILNECKVQFDDRVLKLGVIALGNDMFYETKLRNVGVNPAVFYVSSGNPTDMAITPELGLIPPGDTITLNIQIKKPVH